MHRDVTFVVNRNNSSIFERNFSASPCLKKVRSDRIIVQEGYSSASIAYNDAIEKANTDLIVFAHQDTYFPKDWLEQLGHALESLNQVDPNWGVLGGWGVSSQGLQAGFLYSVGLGTLGAPFERPVAIDTLDEYLLIVRKSSGLRFDPTLAGFHFYGTDICMSARRRGKSCYAISAFAVHNTSYAPLPSDFYKCYWAVRKKWHEFLPIQTPCIRITRWNGDLIARRLKHICFTITGRNLQPLPRLEDPSSAVRSEPMRVESV